MNPQYNQFQERRIRNKTANQIYIIPIEKVLEIGKLLDLDFTKL